MSIESSKSKDIKPVSNPSRPRDEMRGDRPTLRPSGAGNEATATEPQNLINFSYSYGRDAADDIENRVESAGTDPSVIALETPVETRSGKKARRGEKDKELLSSDRWLARNGHSLTYFALYLFSIMVLYRPYEIVPGLEFLSATAVYFGIATLAIYFPTQIATEGNLTIFPTEVKAIFAMTAIALLTMPIAKDPGVAWTTFNDPYIKAVAIFIVLINVVRTRSRLMGMMGLSIGIAVYLSFSALHLYMTGQFAVEGYRVEVGVGGMFVNPNEMAMHLVMMTPIVIALGIASRSPIWRLAYFGMAALFVGANMVTFSRGGFLALVGCSAVLIWKMGRKYRLNVTIASIVIGGIGILAAPGNYGLRMLSIFVPSLDPVGSSNQRSGLLKQSLIVTARNPFGIGIGNFPIVSFRNLVSHNAYTQVSTELGILGLIAYLVFIISPFRKLSAIERTLFEKDDLSWYYYLSIGLQGSIVAYMVASFFASVAYGWFVYYLIAYVVAFRRIYCIENGVTGDIKARSFLERQPTQA